MTARRFILGLALASLLAMSVHKARAAEWDTTDRVLFGSLITMEAIDAAQTWKIHEHPERWSEANPIYGSHPNMGVVMGLKVAVTGGVYWLVKDMPSADRKLVLGVVDALQLSVVARNYSLGLKLGF